MNDELLNAVKICAASNRTTVKEELISLIKRDEEIQEILFRKHPPPPLDGKSYTQYELDPFHKEKDELLSKINKRSHKYRDLLFELVKKEFE